MQSCSPLPSPRHAWYTVGMKLDRTALTVTLLQADTDPIEWRSKPPSERVRAVQINRQVAYGYARATGRLQRVLTVVDLDDLEHLPEPSSSPFLAAFSSGTQEIRKGWDAPAGSFDAERFLIDGLQKSRPEDSMARNSRANDPGGDVLVRPLYSIRVHTS